MTTHVRRIIIVSAQFATVIAILIAWQHVSPSLELAISRPSKVYDGLRTWLSTSLFRDYIGVTVEEAMLGMLVAVGSAVILAALLASVRVLAELLQPFLAVVAALPKLALAPLFLVAFGFGSTSKVYFIAACVWFIPFESVLTALTTTDQTLLTNTRMLGARRRDRIVHVYFPSTVRAVITSIRITAAFSLVSAVISELIQSTQGIGFEIQQAELAAQSGVVIAGVLLVGVIGFCIDRLLVLTQWRLGARVAGS